MFTQTCFCNCTKEITFKCLAEWNHSETYFLNTELLRVDESHITLKEILSTAATLSSELFSHGHRFISRALNLTAHIIDLFLKWNLVLDFVTELFFLFSVDFIYINKWTTDPAPP